MQFLEIAPLKMINAKGMVTCLSDHYLVKEHCRYRAAASAVAEETRGSEQPTKPKVRLSKKEIKEIKDLLTRLRPEVTPSDDLLPLAVDKGVEMVPSIVVDTDAHNIREARFILPFFFPHALRRLMDPKRRQKESSIDIRYERIKEKFMKRQSVVSIPLVYKYVLLKTCLDVYGH